MYLLRIMAGLIVLLGCFPHTTAQTRAIDKQFLDAVQNRDVAKINEALSQGANVNAHETTNGHFALQYAINWPDASLVKLLLDKGANVNEADELGYTALIDASREGGPEYTTIVKQLIERGADVHASNDAAIFGAVKGAEPEVVELLFSKGAPVNARNLKEDGDTVLITAASGGSVETLEMVLAAGADIKATNDKGQTALMKAVTLDHRYTPAQRLPMIELLLQKGANINDRDKNGFTPLLHSVVQFMSEAGGVISHPEVVKLLLDRGADVHTKNNDGNTALLLTAGVWHGPIEIPRLLLEKGVDLNGQNMKGVSALMIAAQKGKLDVVQLLIERGANLNLKDAEDSTAMDYAVSEGQSDVAKLLLAKGGRSKNNYKSETELLVASTNFALLRAATSNNLQDVKKQLDWGADVNTRNQLGDTPLILAIQYGYSNDDVAQFLIDEGADLNIANDNGQTALMWAAERNSSGAAKILVVHKANINLRNKKQQTALHIAAHGLSAKIVETLLSRDPSTAASSAGVEMRGAEVDARDELGRTPLMLAANNEGLVPDEVMRLLLNAGAKVNAQDNDGNTALMLAAKAGSFSGVGFLLSKQADAKLKNNAGMTALKLARKIHENKRIFNADLVEQRIVEMLGKAGAKE